MGKCASEYYNCTKSTCQDCHYYVATKEEIEKAFKLINNYLFYETSDEVYDRNMPKLIMIRKDILGQG